ncbi:MAG: hypothetical protein ACR2PS_04220, partial [Pseudomonadales bacterium]
RSVAGKIIAPLLSPYGVIYGNIASRKNVPRQMHCMSLVYSYFRDEDSNKYAKARDCAETVALSATASSSMHAVLALLYINAFNRQIPDIGDDPLAMAGKAANNAIELDPQNARAHQAVFAVHRARGHRQKALESASRAIALNPFDSSIVGNLAVYLVVIGKLEDAGPLLTRAFELNTARPVWLELFAYLHAELSGRFEEADQIAEGLSPPASPMAALAVVLSALRNGDTEKTERALDTLQRMEPDFLADPATALLRRGFDAGIAERLAARLVTIESNNTLRFASQIPSGPKIAILPVQELSDDAELNQFSRGFAIQLGHDLAKFKDLYLISTNSSLGTDKQSLREITPGLDYIVQASSKRQDAGIRLDMQLLQAGDERVLWSQTYDRKLTPGNLHQVQSEISADIAAQLGTSYGLIQQLETKRVKLNSKLLLSDYACTLRFYSYAADKSPAAHLLQRECLLKVTENVPQYARAWSMLSWVYGDEIRYNYNLSSVQKAKDNALHTALQAVHLDSTDFFTHQYLAVAYALRDQHDLAGRSIERALRLNPNDSDLLARAGWQRIYDGDWETGLLLANKAMQLNPAHPPWYRVMPFINHYRKGEYEEALAQIEAHADDKTSTELIGRMVVLQKLGRHEEATQLKQILQRDFSAFAAEPAKHIARMQLPADVADDIFDTLMSIATNKTTAGD